MEYNGQLYKLSRVQLVIADMADAFTILRIKRKPNEQPVETFGKYQH
jgi:hypothetical protein